MFLKRELSPKSYGDLVKKMGMEKAAKDLEEKKE